MILTFLISISVLILILSVKYNSRRFSQCKRRLVHQSFLINPKKDIHELIHIKRVNIVNFLIKHSLVNSLNINPRPNNILNFLHFYVAILPNIENSEHLRVNVGDRRLVDHSPGSYICVECLVVRRIVYRLLIARLILVSFIFIIYILTVTLFLRFVFNHVVRWASFLPNVERRLILLRVWDGFMVLIHILVGERWRDDVLVFSIYLRIFVFYFINVLNLNTHFQYL